MRAFIFALLTIFGAIAGLVVGAQEPSFVFRKDAMQEKGIAGAICGMIAGGIAAWVTGEKKNQ